MPIEIRPAEAAFAGLTKVSRYPSPDRDGARYLPYPDVQHSPKFTISRSDKILTIGSCFARNIERALRNLNLNVVRSKTSGLEGLTDIANKYTTRSILADLRLALSDEPVTDEMLLRSINVNAQGLARNLALGGMGAAGAKGHPLDQVLKVSREFINVIAQARDADLIILTFGLVEIWYDREVGIYLNIPPMYNEVRRQPGRYELHVLSYEDLRADMIEIFNLIFAKGKPGVKILATISPVPLHTTFRDQDCLQANSYSKAVQRAALEEVLGKFDNVHYFPSYEMVALAAPSVAWVDDDFRHVRPETVDRIMRKVIAAYLGDLGALPPEKDALKRMLAAKTYDSIISTVDRYLAASGKTAAGCPLFIQYYYGASCLALGRTAEGLALIDLVLQANPAHPNANKLRASHSGA